MIRGKKRPTMTGPTTTPFFSLTNISADKIQTPPPQPITESTLIFFRQIPQRVASSFAQNPRADRYLSPSLCLAHKYLSVVPLWKWDSSHKDCRLLLFQICLLIRYFPAGSPPCLVHWKPHLAGENVRKFVIVPSVFF